MWWFCVIYFFDMKDDLLADSISKAVFWIGVSFSRSKAADLPMS
jgi:hypothetical protein